MRGRQRAIAILVCALSAGWLIPLWFGVSSYLDVWRPEAWPCASGERSPDSFPHLAFSRDCLAVSCVWLAMVIAGWAHAFCKALASRRTR